LIRVLFVIDGLYGGGKERQLVEIIRILKDNKTIHLGVITFNKEKFYSDIVKNIVPYYIEIIKRPTRLEPFIHIWKYIREFKPDLIHTWDGLSSLYAFPPSRKYGIRFVNGSIRDAGIEKGFEKVIKRFLLKRADCVIANSIAGLKTYQIEGKVVYNAIDRGRFKKRNESTSFNLVMTANFNGYKDHGTFFKASVQLIQDKTADQAFLLGDGEHKEKYAKWLDANYPSIRGRFHFTGAVRNVEEYLAKCRIGVLSSTSEYGEGVSNSILEYMAAGLVPIVTDVGGTGEIIKNGRNGFLVAPGDSDEIIRIVKMIKADDALAERIRANALNTITGKFSHHENIVKLLKIYHPHPK
jgi:glycosyltransferase involved in cell wall biosynthesis